MGSAPGLTFCRLGPDLAPPLASFFAGLCARGEDRFFHPHPFTAEQADRLCRHDGRDLYYAAIDDEVLAYGMLRGWDAGYLVPSLGIAVHPAARGTGLAKSFMHFLHAAAARRGAPAVRLKVYPDNAAARRLYEGLGYRFENAGDQLVGVFPLGRVGRG
jgi:ribosomal protein S18 acetylase RimI-like enzyme